MTGDPPLLVCSVVRRLTGFAHGISERSSCSWRVGCVSQIWASGWLERLEDFCGQGDEGNMVMAFGKLGTMERSLTLHFCICFFC